MGIKQKTIKLCHNMTLGNPLATDLRHRKDIHEWTVKQVTDSIQYHPGQILNKDEVDALCENGGWKVTIVEWEK